MSVKDEKKSRKDGKDIMEDNLNDNDAHSFYVLEFRISCRFSSRTCQ